MSNPTLHVLSCSMKHKQEIQIERYSKSFWSFVSTQAEVIFSEILTALYKI